MSYESEGMNPEEREALHTLMEWRLEGILSQIKKKPKRQRKQDFQPANREFAILFRERMFEA